MDNLADLPPAAVITFGATLAIIFAMRHFGMLAGRSAAASSAAQAQVAAVIVDPSALNRATAAVEAQTMEMINTRKSMERGIEALCRSADRLSGEVDALKDELIRRSR